MAPNHTIPATFAATRYILTASAGSGGTIQNGSTGISLTNTRSVSLSNMQLNGFSAYAIRGSGVVGFSLTGTTVSGINGDDAGADEGSIRFTELTGVASITGCNISGAVEHNVQVVNTSGLLERLTVQGPTFGSMNPPSGSDGLLIEIQGTAVINATVSNNTFTYAIGDHFQFSVNSSTTNDVIFSNNVLSNAGTAVSGGGGVRLIGGSNAGPINASLSYDVLNNTIRDTRGTAIAVNKLGGNGVFAGVTKDFATFLSASNRLGDKSLANILLETSTAITISIPLVDLVSLLMSTVLGPAKATINTLKTNNRKQINTVLIWLTTNSHL